MEFPSPIGVWCLQTIYEEYCNDKKEREFPSPIGVWCLQTMGR